MHPERDGRGHDPRDPWPADLFGSCGAHVPGTRIQNLVSHATFIFARGFATICAMPRKTPLPEQEREICGRMLEFRRAIQISRVKFALFVDVNQFTLASIEAGRSPVRFSLAFASQTEFRLNIKWLVTGREPMCGGPVFHGAMVTDHNLPVSRAYDLYLRKVVDQLDARVEALKAGGLRLRLTTPVGLPIGESYIDDIATDLRREFKDLSPIEWIELIRRLRIAVREFLAAQNKVILDKSRTDDSVGGMVSVPTWPQLRKLIAEQTSERGAKAALAAKLGVSPQVLTNWLVDREQGAPNAETTLKLLSMFWRPDKK